MSYIERVGEYLKEMTKDNQDMAHALNQILIAVQEAIAYILLNASYVLSFMNDSPYRIPSVLFYGDWLLVILLMFIEVIFIVAMASVCRQAREYDEEILC